MIINHLEMYYVKTIVRLLFLLLLSSIVSGGLVGCSSSKEEEISVDYQITFPQSETPAPVFSTDGGTEEMSFVATSDWSISVLATRSDSWCTVSPTSGKAGKATVSIITLPNDTNDEREAVVTLVCGTKKVQFKVLQKQKDALTTTQSHFEVGDKGGEIEIEIKANISFECTVDAGAESWIIPIEEKTATRGLTTTKKRFSVAENTNTESREGTITITSGKLKDTVTVSQAAGELVQINDEQEVDLGLSVVWASRNVGATKPEEVGNFYAWGEITTKDHYYINSYSLRNDYNDGVETRLDATHDAATVVWGNKWRMPTAEEILELKRSENLQRRRYTYYGVESLLCTAPNGNSIFFPNTGWRDYTTEVQNPDHLGFWSNTVSDGSSNYENAYSYYSAPSGTTLSGVGEVLATVSNRCNGLTVRPVRRPDVQFSGFKSENVTETTADISVSVALDGTPDENIVKAGFQVSVVDKINYHSEKKTITTQVQNGKISAKLDNLIFSTTYFLRPFIQSKKDGMYYGDVVQFTTTGALSTEQWIDMGVSVKWASYNIGTDTPTGKGSWFGWAEVEPRADDSFIHISKCRYYSHQENINIYHNPNSSLQIRDVVHHYEKYAEDGKRVLELEDDAANVIWGENARMPTKQDWEELVANTDRREATVSGVYGWLYISKKNNNVIFFPEGDYWTSSVGVEDLKSYKKNSDEILKIYHRYDDAFYADSKGEMHCYARNYCHMIRAVYK